MNKEGINVLSLFDGHSTGMLALIDANIKVNKYYASEIEENAIKISKKNFPEIIHLGNINKIDLTKLPKIDLILLGSPCQGFSRQGKGLNFKDPRSKLFFVANDIIHWIKINNNPNVKFLMENVEMKKEWENVISDKLGVKCISINSKLLSAQNRPRLYWSSEKIKLPQIKEQICLLDIIDKNIDTSNYIEYKGLLLDSTISKQQMELIDVVNGEVRIKQAVKKGYIIAKNGDGINLSFPTSKTRRGRVIKQKSNTLDTGCVGWVYYNNIIRPFTIEELERLQTLPIGYTEGIDETDRKKLIGNGWTKNVISFILKQYKF